MLFFISRSLSVSHAKNSANTKQPHFKVPVSYDSLGEQNRKHEYIIKGDLFSGLKAMAPLVQ